MITGGCWSMLTKDLNGTSMDARVRPIERKATSKVPSVRDRFNSVLNDQLVDNNMHAKILTSTMNCFNKRTQCLIKFLDKQCRKARIGQTSFSKEAQQMTSVQKLMLCRIKLTERVGCPWKRWLQSLANQSNYEVDGNLMTRGPLVICDQH